MTVSAGLYMIVSYHGNGECITYYTEERYFQKALKFEAVSIVLLHNHPSGDATPSRNDIEVTRRIAQAGSLLGINLIDHIA